MSDSPKWTSVRVSPEVRLQLREERRRRREQQRARRAAEREHRRQERLWSAQCSLERHVASAEAEVQSFTASETGQFSDRSKVDELLDDLKGCRSQAKAAKDEQDLKPVRKRLQRAQSRLRHLVSEAESRQFAERLQQEEAALARINRRVPEIGSERSARFDPEGLIAIDRLLRQAQTVLRHESLDEARSLLEQTRDRIAEHEAVVEERAARWEERIDQAKAGLATVLDAISELKGDDAVLRWRPAEVQQLEGRVNSLMSEVEAGSLENVHSTQTELMQELGRLREEADGIQQKEDERRYIADAICLVMQRLGFNIQPGYPSLQSESPESEIVVWARRPGGGEIAVVVPQDGDIWYQVAGYRMHEGVGAQAGQISRSCDEAERDITAINDVLQKEFSVETGELMWRGKEPQRLSKQAKQLPGSNRRERKQGQ